MEGWDCPFAYLLVMLDNTQAQRAITQLVGRVMRQPYAQLTGRELLDQCYVYCNNAEVGTVVQQVKNGLEEEGLTGLGDEVMGKLGSQQQQGEMQQLTVYRRERFKDQDIFLPVVSHKDGDDWIQLDYQSHILPHINWSEIEPPDPSASASDSARRQSAAVNFDEIPVYYADQALDIDKTVRVSHFTRHLSDILPNPWQAARITGQLIEDQKQDGKTDAYIYDRRAYLAHLLREHVKDEVEVQAEQVFHKKLNDGKIRFDLEVGQPNFRMVHNYDIQVRSDDRQLEKRYGESLQLSLFEPVFERYFSNELEKKFACYLDEQRAVQWWHRVAARQQGEYYLQGWKRGRIYPDFVAMANETHLLIFETKGEHLIGNPDTEYKRKVLKALEGAFNTVGTMRLRDGSKSIFQLVFSEHDFSQITARLGEEYSHS